MNAWKRDQPIGLALLKLWTWNLFALTLLAILYWAIISEGLRFLLPFAGQKLYKLPIPGFSVLRNYEWTYRLDLAHGMSIIIFIATWNLWGLLLKAWLGDDEEFHESGWDTERFRTVVIALGVVVLGADAVLFFLAMTQMGWSGGGFSFSALLATALYVAVLMFVKLVSINLEKEV